MTDLWKWVRDTSDELEKGGEERLATLVDQIPTFTCNDRHAQVDASVPEAVAGARRLNMSWLEVFLRHWHLQSLILHRHQAKGQLPEAIDLLEFAHREENKDCPQSVCVTQDVAATYGLLDGKGYAQERLDVASETLARIDPSWPCFICIGNEYVDALLDRGDVDEALTFLESMLDQIRDAGKMDWYAPQLSGYFAEVLMQLGRYDEALDWLRRYSWGYFSEHTQVSRLLDEARVLARMGDWQAAVDCLPPDDQIDRTVAHYRPMADALHLLAKGGGVPNDWQVGAKLWRFASRKADLGVVRQAIDIFEIYADLALERGAPHLAELAADRIEALIVELRAELGANAMLATLRARIEAHPGPQTDELRTRHDEGEDILAEDFEALLYLLREDGPGDDAEGYINGQIFLFRAIGLHDIAFELLEKELEAAPLSESLHYQIGSTLLEGGRLEQLRAHAASILAMDDADEGLKGLAHWLVGRGAMEVDDWEGAKQAFAASLALVEGSPSTPYLFARACRELSQYEEAFDALAPRVESDEASPDMAWELIVVASVLQRWSAVRVACRYLGMDFGEGDEPFNNTVDPIVVRFADDPERRGYLALRDGPATAIVWDLHPPDQAVHVRDLVVFDPGTEEGGDERLSIFDVVAVTEPANYRRFTIDGIHPGDEAVEELRDRCRELEVHLQDWGSQSYEIVDESGAEVRGLYALMGVPPGADLEKLAIVLHNFESEHQSTLMCPELTRELGDDERRDLEQARYERLGIDPD